MVYDIDYMREYMRKYHETHKDEERIKSQIYRNKNEEKLREKSREYASRPETKEKRKQEYKKSRGKHYFNNRTMGKKHIKIPHNKLRDKSLCTIIKSHHEAMKDDPEHLTTEFLKKLINVDCNDLGDD